MDGGEVVAIHVSNAGSGYAAVPEVIVANPPPKYETFWSNDGSSSGGGEPGSAVSLAVSGGIFSVILGDTSLAGMSSLPAETFENSPVFLRVWFNDGVGGSTQLTPDQPITATPYAMKAASVPAGAIGRDQINGSIGLWSNIEGGLFTQDDVGIGVSAPLAPLHVEGSVITGFALNEASGLNSFVSGGASPMEGEPHANIAGGDYSFVGGGIANLASGVYAFVGGGSFNNAAGASAFVGGGENNTAAGMNSFAAGRRARAVHDGSFVWGDSTIANFSSTAANQFLIRANGGVGINTNNPGAFALAVTGSAAKTGGGSWSVFSDARLKHSIEPIVPGILDRLLTLNGYTFQYNDHAVERRLALPGEQIGLIAQEVVEVFPDWVDEDEEGYLYVTERGTTALLIETLRELRAEKDRAVAELQEENRLLRNQMMNTHAEMEKRLARIEALLVAEELAAR